MSRRPGVLIGIGLVTMLAAAPLAQPGSTSWDAKFRELPQASNIRASMERMSARPHHVGSPYDKDNAEWMLARFKEWGWDARDRNLQRAVSHAEGTRARAARADALHRDARGAAGGRRSDVEPEERAAADLQRLLD